MVHPLAAALRGGGGICMHGGGTAGQVRHEVHEEVGVGSQGKVGGMHVLWGWISAVVTD